MPSINDSDKFEIPSNEPVLSSQLMKKFWISPLPSSLDHSIHHVRAHQSYGDPSRFDTFGSVLIFDSTKADNGEPSWRSALDGFEGWCVDLLFHARHLFEANAKRQTPNAKFQLKNKAKPLQIFQKDLSLMRRWTASLCGACKVMMSNPRFIL